MKDNDKVVEEPKQRSLTKAQIVKALESVPDDAEILCRGNVGTLAYIIGFSNTYLLTDEYRYTFDLAPIERHNGVCFRP